MKQRVRDLVEQGDQLFSKRQSIHSLWQSIAEQFYPERADFTQSFTLGQEFADHLMTGRPVLARRDLANSFSAMLRPRGKQWFKIRTDNEQINEDASARKWLDQATDRLARAMFAQESQFVRATKEGDNDFAAFGQCVIEVQPNSTMNGLLFRSWHLRDVAWCENSELEIDTVHRNWKLEAVKLNKLFPKTVHKSVAKAAEKEPYKLIKCRHIVIPSDQYEYSDDEKKSKRKIPFMSIYVDVENETILEEVPVRRMRYVIPRWVTVSGSQYAVSPATVVALPDARLIQRMTLTLLEAGEKVVDPPTYGIDGAIQGGLNLYAGGHTHIDAEFAEAMGTAGGPLRQFQIDGRGLQWGVDREQRVAELIQEAFFLNAIQVPALEGDMTATEFRGRYEEYLRRALPLFEPMEVEYNGGLCLSSFEEMQAMNLFGSPANMPPILSGQSIRFQFESPLQQANERAKAQAFIDAGNLLKEAVQLDPGVRHDVDMKTAFRDALIGVGAPADWVTSEEYAMKMRAADQQAAQMAQMAQVVGGGAEVAGKVGEGMMALQEAGVA
jgi:hypothetical protein